MIAVQPGAVVSQTLVKNRGGSVTLFAFDAGEGLSEHSTPHEAVIQILEGTARVTIGEQLHVVIEGQALRLPAGVPHAVHAETPFKMLLIMLKNEEINA
ncbi:MAG: cupin domain-containing protein [Gemmatimonadetes bacterium]|nr:cupin domain-containing protein [Gemmatimonadota bacterium]